MTDQQAPESVIAYVRVPPRGPAWPVHDPVAVQQRLGTMLMGRHSGRRHLTGALQAAGPGGLPVVLVHVGTVIAAARLISISEQGMSLVSDQRLAGQLAGRFIEMLPGMTVQVRRSSIPATTAPPMPPRTLPPSRPMGRLAQYEWTMAAMDMPPAL
jgi:hypothetical protein